MDLTSVFMEWDNLRNFIGLIIKVQTMSNLPTLSVALARCRMWLMIFLSVLERVEASGTLHHFTLWDIGWMKMDLGDFPPI